MTTEKILDQECISYNQILDRIAELEMANRLWGWSDERITSINALYVKLEKLAWAKADIIWNRK